MGPLAIAGIAGGVQALGGLFGGRKRKKEAARVERDSVSDRFDAVSFARDDQQRAIDYRMDDENRLKAATGYDLVKLRDDALKAGFNPLTVLNATGGASYDGRGAVLTTPFISSTEAFLGASGAVNAARGMKVDTAGYVGDAISAGGSAFVSAYFNQQQLANDRMIAQAAVNNAGSSIRAQAVQQGGSFPQQAAAVSVSPQNGASWWQKLTGAADKFLDRVIERDPVTDTPAWMIVDDGRGNSVYAPAASVFDDGPMAWIREYITPLQLGAMQWGDQVSSWGRALDAMRPPSDGLTPDEVYTPFAWPKDPAF